MIVSQVHLLRDLIEEVGILFWEVKCVNTVEVRPVEPVVELVERAPARSEVLKRTEQGHRVSRHSLRLMAQETSRSRPRGWGLSGSRLMPDSSAIEAHRLARLSVGGRSNDPLMD